jgi:hypothetical protein
VGFFRWVFLGGFFNANPDPGGKYAAWRPTDTFIPRQQITPFLNVVVSLALNLCRYRPLDLLSEVRSLAANTFIPRQQITPF